MRKWKSLSCAALLVAASAVAGPGHDHGDAAASRPAGAATPRFATHSDVFEIVGVLQGEELVIYVDRYDDNTPVTDAKLEIESGAFKATGRFVAERGTYSVPGEVFKQPGSHPIQIAISAGKDVDLLGTDLVVPDPHAGHDHGEAPRLLRRYALGSAGTAFIAFVLGWLWMRRARPGAA